MHNSRHVLATTITTVAGFMPLLVAGGGFWPPLAIAIAGGVFGATLLALYFVPAAYLLLMGREAEETSEVPQAQTAPALIATDSVSPLAVALTSA